MNATLRPFIVLAAVLVIFPLLWESMVWADGWPNFVMASLSDLPSASARHWDLFLIGGWQTLWRTVVGLLIAVVFGLLLGMVMGFPVLQAKRSVPFSSGSTPFPKRPSSQSSRFFSWASTTSIPCSWPS